MEYYIYIYLNPLKPGKYKYKKFEFDFEPFYVGLGKNNRINQHISESKYNKHKSLKDNLILKILKNEKEPIRYKLYENLTLYSAIRFEKYLIKLIGRRDLNTGSLPNLTIGGECCIMTEYIKKKIKDSLGVSRMGEKNSNYGKKWTNEQKLTASDRQKKTHIHFIGENNPAKKEEVRIKISNSKIGNKNPNYKKWILISPNKEEFIIEGGIKRNLKEKFNLTYSMFGYYKDNEKRKTKNGWILKEF